MSSVDETEARFAAMRAGRKTYAAVTACPRGHVGKMHITENGDVCEQCEVGLGVPRTIINYSEAQDRGLIRYFTGKPCRKGHVAERFTSNGACVTCSGIATRGSLRDKRRATVGLAPAKVTVLAHVDDAWAVTGFANLVLAAARAAGRPVPIDLISRVNRMLQNSMHPDLACLHPQDQEALATTARELTALRALLSPPPTPAPLPAISASTLDETRRIVEGELDKISAWREPPPSRAAVERAARRAAESAGCMSVDVETLVQEALANVFAPAPTPADSAALAGLKASDRVHYEGIDPFTAMYETATASGFDMSTAYQMAQEFAKPVPILRTEADIVAFHRAQDAKDREAAAATAKAERWDDLFATTLSEMGAWNDPPPPRDALEQAIRSALTADGCPAARTDEFVSEAMLKVYHAAK